MKRIAILSILAALSTSGIAFAQSAGMSGMDMKNMHKKNCMDMKDMKDMDMNKCMDMMKGMDMDKKAQGAGDSETVHKAAAVVKKVDPSTGTVTLAHGPVPTLKWPAMTMGFSVNDKALLDKLAIGKKVNVEFVQKGADYVITAVK